MFFYWPYIFRDVYCIVLFIKGLHFLFLHQCSRITFFFTPRGMMPRGVSVLAMKIWITQQKLNQNRKFLTHWSVAQAGSNYEKNWSSKISLDCPFKTAKRNVMYLIFPQFIKTVSFIYFHRFVLDSSSHWTQDSWATHFFVTVQWYEVFFRPFLSVSDTAKFFLWHREITVANCHDPWQFLMG